jgi:hypothetical protein
MAFAIVSLKNVRPASAGVASLKWQLRCRALAEAGRLGEVLAALPIAEPFGVPVGRPDHFRQLLELDTEGI